MSISPLRTFSAMMFCLTLLAQLLPASGPAAQVRTIDDRPQTIDHQPSYLLFVQNTGQFDPQVRFQLHGAGGTWWFTDDGIWLTVLQRPQTTDRGPQPDTPWDRIGGRRSAVGGPWSGINLHLTFAGMLPTAHLSPINPQSSKMNYFKGSDAAKWRSDAPTFASLRWEGVYPGISLLIGGQPPVGGGLGMMVEAAAGVDLSALRLHVDGADQVQVDDMDHLLANTALGPLTLPALVDEHDRILHSSITGNEVAFTEDPSATSAAFRASVVQSPRVPNAPADEPSDLLYSTFLGGSHTDDAYDIQVDAGGSMYLLGQTFSTDFPTTPGAFKTAMTDYLDVFVTNIDSSGQSLVYSTYLGGGGDDYAYLKSLFLDANGNVYLTGDTESYDFPTTPGAFQTAAAPPDVFVTKLNSSGDALLYSTLLVGGYVDYAYGIAVAADGTAYVTGFTMSSDFPTTPGAFDTYFDGYFSAAFVTQLNATGTALVASTFLDGGMFDEGQDLVVDATGQVYVAGNTESSDFPTTPSALDTVFGGGGCGGLPCPDGFVTKLSSDFSYLLYSMYLGGNQDECNSLVPCSLAVDAAGSVYITGNTTSPDFPTTPGAFQSRLAGASDIFVSKLDPPGAHLVYSTLLGGADNDDSQDIALAPDGSVFLTGTTWSDDFPLTATAYDSSYAGGDVFSGGDAMLAQLNATGTAIVYSTYLGGRQRRCRLWSDTRWRGNCLHRRGDRFAGFPRHSQRLRYHL